MADVMTSSGRRPMRRKHVFVVFIFSATMMLMSSELLSSELPSSGLDDHLKFLEAFLGKDWVGGFVGEDAPDLKISLLFESILDGRAVKYTREAEGADFASVTHFYWNPKLAQVCFISLNNRGIVEEGNVSVDDDDVVLSGSSYRAESTMEFRTTLSIDEEGILRDSFVRKEDEEWVRGHVQEFVAEVQLKNK
jgi:hypothetical protein